MKPLEFLIASTINTGIRKSDDSECIINIEK